MASREWLITRVAMTSLAIVTLISISIVGANVLFEVKRDVERVDNDLGVHTIRDDKNWDKAWEDIDLLKEKDHQLELQNTRIEENQKEILRRLDENKNYYEKSHSDMMNFMKNFEVE